MKTEKVKAKEKEQIKLLYRTKYLPDFLAFIALYPFHTEDLEGEIWAYIKGYEGLYQISNYGRIKSFAIRKYSTGAMILKPKLAKNGYLMVSLNKNRKGRYFLIHRIVAQTFIPNPENKSTVNHKDGNKFNNCVENLEWQTQSENNHHAVNTGLSKSGEDCTFAKLTKEDVKFIREHYMPRDLEYSGAALAKKFNVSTSCINLILHGKTYKNAGGEKNFE